MKWDLMVAWKKSAKIYAIRYFSRTLSFVPNVGDESLVETTLHLRFFGLLSTVCNYFQFIQLFFLSQPPLDIFFQRYVRIYEIYQVLVNLKNLKYFSDFSGNRFWMGWWLLRLRIKIWRVLQIAVDFFLWRLETKFYG